MMAKGKIDLLSRRLLAHAVDWGVIYLIALPTTYFLPDIRVIPLQWIPDEASPPYGIFFILAFLLPYPHGFRIWEFLMGIIYQTMSVWLLNGTLGHLSFELQVKNKNKHYTFLKVLWRSVASYIFGMMGGLTFWIAFVHPKGQTLHDLVSGLEVVLERKQNSE